MREDAGQDVIEYALLAAGISIVAIPTIPTIGVALGMLYKKIATALSGI